MDYLDLIVEIAENKWKYISKHGFAQPGCNGPYKNMDTSVRNSAHWICSYAFLWETAHDIRYHHAVEILSEYILRSENYGKSGNVCSRKDRYLDKTNGLIGPAWTIEGLIYASKILNDKKYTEKAKKLFLLHPFNETDGIWEILDLDGTRSFDVVYNHQLWFAAAGAMLIEQEYDKKIDDEIRLFLKCSADKLFAVHEDGLIVHSLAYQLKPEEVRQQKKSIQKRRTDSLLHSPFKSIKRKVKGIVLGHPDQKMLENGYQLFNLYGFALLKKEYGEEAIFRSSKFQSALQYAINGNNLSQLMEPQGRFPFNPFSFSYNSPAFEYPFVCEIFGKRNHVMDERLFQFQINHLYDYKNRSFTKQCDDPETLDARIYELTRFLRSEEHSI